MIFSNRFSVRFTTIKVPTSNYILRIFFQQNKEKEHFLILVNKNLLGDITFCLIVLCSVIAVVIGTFNIYSLQNTDDVIKIPGFKEYWFQQTVPCIALATVCIFIIANKSTLRNFILQEGKEILANCKLRERLISILD